eukprot:TRINITY_DN14111_c0_g1_i1.p1 TRINITY_DN14111_c0_g1~~TRINITY_DN14111_c0_g1_i1.p1  ORF type:complete len:967 (+),score=277.85 TRINITY_DN14111_c0_g1_i1:73-2901(+)
MAHAIRPVGLQMRAAPGAAAASPTALPVVRAVAKAPGGTCGAAPPTAKAASCGSSAPAFAPRAKAAGGGGGGAIIEERRRLLELKRETQSAAMRVRRAILRFRHATVATVGELQEQMETAHREEEAKLGLEADRVRQEMETALLQVYERLESAIGFREQLESVALLLSGAEDATKRAREAGEQLAAASAEEASAEEQLAAAQAMREAVATGEAALQEATAAFAQKWRELGAASTADREALKASDEYQALHRRLAASKVALERLATSAADAEQQATEDARIASLQKAVVDVVAVTESSLAEAKEAVEALSAGDDGEQEQLDSVEATATAEAATEVARTVLEQATQMLSEKGREMGHGPAATAVKRSPLFRGLQGRLRRCEQELKRLAAATTAAHRDMELRERFGPLHRASCDSVTAAESALELARETGERLSDQALTADELLSSATATEEAVAEADAAVKDATRVVQQNNGKLGPSPEAAAWRQRPGSRRLQERLTALRSELQQLRASAAAARERAPARAALLRAAEKQQTAFAKYDLDADGVLNLEEVAAFALGEYGCKLVGDPLQRLFDSIASANGDADSAAVVKGVRLEDLQRLRAGISIEKAVARSREAEAESARQRELQARLAEEAKEAREAAAARRAERMAAAEEALGDAEAACVQVIQGIQSAGASAAGYIKLQGVEAAIATGRAALARLEEQLKEDQEEGEADTKAAAQLPKATARLRARGARAASAFDKASGELQSARRAVREHLRQLGGRVAYALRSTMKAQGETVDALLTRLSDTGELDATQLLNVLAQASKGTLAAAAGMPACLRCNEPAASAAELEGLCAYITGEAEVIALNLEHIERLVQGLRFHVVRDTVLTSDSDVSPSSVVLRRLQRGESLQALGLPEPQRSIGGTVWRLRCSAGLDDAEGWASVAGNQGTVFLEPRLDIPDEGET